ncbi:MAG: response regulator transcription factor [Thermoflexales bacterium]
MMSASPIRVMVVDDHPMVRLGLATFLKVYDDLELVGEADDGAAALQLCKEVLPDVVLMDMVMPTIDGVAATRAIRQQFPSTQVIALTSFKEEGLVEKALQAGAIGYLLKDVSAERLVAAIRSAHKGKATLSPEATQILVEAANKPRPPGHDLTKREWAVLALLVEGLNNTQIAHQLGVSSSTVKTHVSAILSKFGVESRTEAAALALRHHLIA